MLTTTNYLCSIQKGEEEGGNEEKREALLQLAINAARIKHLLQKSEYDEMHNLDVGKDIKIVFTSIGLPIGSKCIYLVF